VTISNFTNINRPILEPHLAKYLVISEYLVFLLNICKLIILLKIITLYSCRHFYITTKLQDGVDVYVVAKYVGNSVEMIQRFYDHHTIGKQENIDKLTGEKSEVIF